jgi:hypothetical protein
MHCQVRGTGRKGKKIRFVAVGPRAQRLIEVFFEDWKGYEGWSALTMQPGAERSSRSLILSLLVDQCLLLHPDQLAQLKHRQPAFTVGSLINRIKVESVLTVIREVLTAADPEYHLRQLSDTLVQYFDLRPSEKHMVGRWGAWSHHHRSNTKLLHDRPGPTLASSALSSDKNSRIEYTEKNYTERQEDGN